MFRFAFKGSPTLSRFNRPILENSSKKFSEFLAGSCARLISGKLNHIWMSFPKIGPFHDLNSVKNVLSTKFSFLGKISRNRSLSNSSPQFYNRLLDEFSRTRSGLRPDLEKN